MDRLEEILNGMKEAIDEDSFFLFMNYMDELEELKGTKFLMIALKSFAQTIPEGSMIDQLVKDCNEPDQGGEE
jgi:hypothetical protein|nr:hypothetical protein [Heyndrickxia oleronia]